MKQLPKQPKAPKGVKYALTVPQSVLFADLSLRGNRKNLFKAVLGINYEPEYIAIDAGGAMSWNYDDDKEFERQILQASGSAVDAIDSFIASMERTARNLNKVAKSIESDYLRTGKNEDLIADLRAYWDAYEQHMISLFTFWNVERMLSDKLTTELQAAGRQGDIDDGLSRYLRPNEPNYFMIERTQLKKIAERFSVGDYEDLSAAPKALVKALETHRNTYGFLLAPFNLENPLPLNELLDRAKEVEGESQSETGAVDRFLDLAPGVRRLAVLTQRFTFWKSERLDMFVLADARAANLYRQVAAALSMQLKDLFAMTSREMVQSLRSGEVSIDRAVIKQRQKSYCLILSGGKIDFYEPCVSSGQNQDDGLTELTGVAASAGLATGPVRLINDLKDAKLLKNGEIIVTAMTRPEMGAALDRAVAFVTDEGGMLCHAAIISREMKKPCVIAIGNATKVLRNGQKIEVDGAKGVVRII